MNVKTHQPVSVGTLRWKTAAGAARLTVIVKATFALVHEGAATLVEEPEPLFDDEHFENNDQRSLRLATDRVPRKARVDVLFAGGIYAPTGERVRKRTARIHLESAGKSVLDKSVLAIGSRSRDGDAVSEPSTFAFMPVRYELSYGGRGSKINPIGVGADAADEKLPSLVDPTLETRVSGLGPVPPRWFWRSRAAGGTDPKAWLDESPSLPKGVDFSFFNAAPPDQQIALLRGDEWLVLEGLHPMMARVRSRLPSVRALARVEHEAGPQEIKLVADTLFIDGDQLRASVTWRGDVPIESVGPSPIAVTLSRGDEAPDYTAKLAPPPTPEGAVVEAPALFAAPAELLKYQPVVTHVEPEQAVGRAVDPPPRVGDLPKIVNTTKYAAFAMPWQTRPPQDVLVVVVKATYTLKPDGVPTLAAEQDPPMGNLYTDDDPKASLRYPSDFAVFKPAADVIVVGHAHRATEDTTAHVQIQFGELKRRLAIFGDRTWDKMGAMSKPTKFTKMPLVYERAMGGNLSEENPVGRGYKSAVLLPNLEDPEHLLRSSADTTRPACFAPIAPLWRARAAKLGTYDARWLKSRWPYFPADFDWRYFNAAPPEQQVPPLRGDEHFVLQGLNAEHPVVRGRLPGLAPRVFAQKTKEGGANFFEVLLRLDTAWIDADAMKLVLVWRGLFDVSDDEAGDIAALFVAEDRLARHLTAKDAQKRLFAELEIESSMPAKNLPFPDEETPEAMALAAPVATAPEIAAWVRDGALARKDLSHADLSKMDLTGKDLTGAVLLGAKLMGTLLVDAKLEGAVLAKAKLIDANLTGADLTLADLQGADLTGAVLTKAKLAKANATQVQAAGVDFRDAVATEALFVSAKLERARFDRAFLASADFTGAKLDGASFLEATLTDTRLMDVTGDRVVFDKASAEGLRAMNARLTRSSFVGIKAPRSNWERATLTSANFQDATLSDALFVRANLEGATLNKARLERSQLKRARLRDASLLRANLMQARLERAVLERADLRGANLYQAETWRADLRDANLELALRAGSKLA